MKLREFLEHLGKIRQKHGEVIMEYELVAASDDEGNEFNKVIYAPAIGKLDDGNTFIAESQLAEYEIEEEKPYVICIN